MIKKVTIFLIAVLLVISTLNAVVYSPKMTKHMRYGLYMAEKNLFSGRLLLRMKDDIGLTEDQVAKIEKLGEMHHESLIKRNADIKVLELKFNSYLKEEKVNRAKLEKMIREIAILRTDLQVEQINHLLDLRELLTTEQLAKIDELKKKMRRRRMDRRKEWRKDKTKDRFERR